MHVEVILLVVFFGLSLVFSLYSLVFGAERIVLFGKVLSENGAYVYLWFFVLFSIYCLFLLLKSKREGAYVLWGYFIFILLNELFSFFTLGGSFVSFGLLRLIVYVLFFWIFIRNRGFFFVK